MSESYGIECVDWVSLLQLWSHSGDYVTRI